MSKSGYTELDDNAGDKQEVESKQVASLEVMKEKFYDAVNEFHTIIGEEEYRELDGRLLDVITPKTELIQKHLSDMIEHYSLDIEELVLLVRDADPVNGLDCIKDDNLRAEVLEKIIIEARDNESMTFHNSMPLVAEWMNSIENDKKRTRLIGKLEPQDLLQFLTQDFSKLDKLQAVEHRMPELFSKTNEGPGEWKNNSSKLERITYVFDECKTIGLKADILNHVVGLEDRHGKMVGEKTAIGLSKKFLDSQMAYDHSTTKQNMQQMCEKCNDHAAYFLLKSAMGNDKQFSVLNTSAHPQDINKATNFETEKFGSVEIKAKIARVAVKNTLKKSSQEAGNAKSSNTTVLVEKVKQGLSK